MTFKIREKPELGSLATFVPNKNLPVYDWFYYKEGFARDFVWRIIQEFSMQPGAVLLDPFCGSGTTCLACKQLGISSFGFDVLPISVFVSRVKTADYDIEELKIAAKSLLKLKFEKPSNIPNRVSGFTQKFFSPYALQDAVFFRDRILPIEDARMRDFLMLALMNSTMKCSFAMKDGAVIKFEKRHVAPLRIMLKRTLLHMIKDIENFKSEQCRTEIDYGDARQLRLEDSSIDSVITSPPYLNKIEYTNIYRIEEELFLPREEKPGIRSFVGYDESKLEGRDFSGIDSLLPNLPVAAKPYFHDMNLAIEELFRVCKPGSRVALVVGDGLVGEQVVNSSEILCELAQRAGFKVNEVVIMSKRIATTPSRHRVGEMKESLLLWEKE